MKTKEEIQTKYNALIAEMGLAQYDLERLTDHKAKLKVELDNLAIDFSKLKEKGQENGKAANN